MLRKAAAPKFRLTAPSVAEDDLHVAVARNLAILVMPPAVWTSLPIGHIQLTGQQASKFVRLGVQRSWPDIICIHAGRPYGLELKRPGGRLSRTRLVPTRKGGKRLVEGQQEGFVRLQAAGMEIAVCETVEAALEALRGFGVPLRRTT